jgi:hypothetical protein
MSDPLRVAFVVEGPTDYAILKELVRRFLGNRDFVPQILQPEMSEAFKVTPGTEGGWPGVCRWCVQTREQSGGDLANNPLFVFHDILIIQLDADVAGFRYSDGYVPDPCPRRDTLPFQEPCPPASATTDRLREILLLWLGESTAPPGALFCLPSKALEAWVAAGLFPNDATVRADHLECRSGPESILRGKPKAQRLVSGNKKNIQKYREFASAFAENWDFVKNRCAEAERFETDFFAELEAGEA